jgi:hypothetical protein
MKSYTQIAAQFVDILFVYTMWWWWGGCYEVVYMANVLMLCFEKQMKCRIVYITSK